MEATCGVVHVQGGHGPVHGEQVGQLFLEGHSVPPTPGLFIGIRHTLVLDLHSLHLGPALHSVPVMDLHLHMLGNALDHIPVAVLFAELVLGLPLTPDGD